ncbi:MAG: thioredoxin family protein [Pseudomonadota bacterium]|nr:thioredoxin family protein [Pseudomonadota bacterium]
MSRFHRLLRAIVFLALIFSPLLAQAQPPYAWTEPGADGKPQVHLYFFWSLRCPHCLEARPEVEAMARAQPWVVLHSLELSRHRDNVERYIAMAAALGQQAQSVPAFLFCGQMQVGWDSAAITGAALLKGLQDCREQAAGGNAGAVMPSTADSTLHLPLLGALDARSLSLPVLTVLIAGMDAFNPCAFFVLLFLLSLLVHQRDRRRMALIGGVFVLFSGLMYFAFMAAWLGLFRIMGSLPWVTTAAGALAFIIGLVNTKDFFAVKSGVSLSIPETRKADIFRRGRAILAAGSLPAMLVATVLLAIAANFYELLCTAGFPMVYTRLLTMQVENSTQHLAYLALYNVIYVLPLLLIVFAFVRTLGARKLSEREGRLLKLLSGLMMLGLGILLLAAPEWLNNLAATLGLMLAAVGLTWLAARMTRD